MYSNSQIRNDMPNLIMILKATWQWATFSVPVLQSSQVIRSYQLLSHITKPMPSNQTIHAVYLKMDDTHYAINEQGHITLSNTNEYELFKRANRNNIKLHMPSSKIGKQCYDAYINRNSI